ncbi:hypothetical protein LOTGIDRAFT_147776 [Lottia gigantea]|uniref:Plastocyanin-like domain-containing protein n=1 Tax=Lottia gigantea TaxID=225164 RepID=V4A607_LOTGI|nr:hypothetical protein LOTGIDRAFT_147776 [Lottia gigantea]ESO90420.1 hypothetical protein LOTGIDRAFT_147776 [Lottia gigantea]
MHSVTLVSNKLYQIILTNMGIGKGWAHPVHMHGHSFDVVKMGYSTYDKETGKILEENMDIDCGGDTIIVPSGGYVVLRIMADNPGIWFMHCHIELHNHNGMALLLNESFHEQPMPPAGFPTCGSYNGDEVNGVDRQGR